MLKLLQKWSHDFSSAQNDKIFLITMDCLLGPIQRPIHQTPLVHYCKLVMHEVGVVIVANLNPISSQFLNRGWVDRHLVLVCDHPDYHSPLVGTN